MRIAYKIIKPIIDQSASRIRPRGIPQVLSNSGFVELKMVTFETAMTDLLFYLRVMRFEVLDK